MYVIVGLGNLGKRYEQTRHNMGFITVDYLADDLNIKINKLKHKALVGEGNIGREKIMLVKPQTYMNLSGESIREIVEYYKIPAENLILIYDDLDIDLGEVRIRKKGSAGTHNGMRSTIKLLGFDDFPRIRIGIGKNIKMDTSDFVTGGFNKEEKEPLEKAVINAAKAVHSIITEGLDKAMNKYNGKS